MIPHFKKVYQKSFPKQIFSNTRNGCSIYNLIKESENFKLIPQLLVFMVENVDEITKNENVFNTSIDIKNIPNVVNENKITHNLKGFNTEDKSNSNIFNISNQNLNIVFANSHENENSPINSILVENFFPHTSNMNDLSYTNPKYNNNKSYFMNNSYDKIKLESALNIPNNKFT